MDHKMDTKNEAGGMNSTAGSDGSMSDRDESKTTGGNAEGFSTSETKHVQSGGLTGEAGR